LIHRLGLPTRLRIEVPAEVGGVAEKIGRIPLELADGPPNHAAAIARAGGRRIRWEAGALLCETGFGREAAVLDALRDAGVAGAGITVRQPGLEEVYRLVTAPDREERRGARSANSRPPGFGPGLKAPRRRPATERNMLSGGGAR
jgi:hypothetical protein